jgi:hypothetical protein
MFILQLMPNHQRGYFFAAEAAPTITNILPCLFLRDLCDLCGEKFLLLAVALFCGFLSTIY